ncbi:DNA/RNA nuclease SfsA [Candidatus Marinamargulisbacteria bacterium SCGC AG-343-K17]|nr:DNA/RNA nuclease SfsA [Candidatus Marinamargulisbacteria bacterium SCGC AG-343-K17]
MILSLHQPRVYGTLIKRYKRFLADVELASGEIITAHCPNPGRMLTCSDPGSKVRLSVFDDGKRKYPHRLDLVHNGDCWIGVNPNLANDIVGAAIDQGLLFSELDPAGWQREVPYAEKHRIDFMHGSGKQKCFVEVKSVTYAEAGVGYFPDAVSKRATLHLHALSQMVKDGYQANMVYCIQRPDVNSVEPAAHIDSKYAEAVDEAVLNGVTCIPFSIRFDESGDAVFNH